MAQLIELPVDQPAAGDFLGYPKGAWLIIGVEFWERFSFYGLMSILALFLTNDTQHGGFGWPAAQALSFVGIYTFLMYALPAAGGYVADRVLGRRRAVLLGASIMLLGQILLVSPVFLPEIIGRLHGAPVLETLRGLGVPLAEVLPAAEVHARIAARGGLLDAREGALWLEHAYLAASLGFYAAIVCLVLGNALMKSTLVVLCGDTMGTSDPRREGAFTYYYWGISIGAMLSGIAVGEAVQILGWQYGFAVVILGMTLALGSYVTLASRWLGSIGLEPDSAATSARGRAGQPKAVVLRRIGLLFVLGLQLCAFSVGWFQLFGSWLLFLDKDVDRSIGTFVIPVPWFASLNAAVVFVVAPFVGMLWVRLAARNLRVDILQKYSFALAMVTLGHVLMYLTARGATPDARAAVILPLIALSLLAIGELVAWTATYGMVQRAAPTGYASVAMGAWYLLTLALGGYLAGKFAGALVDSVGYAATFGGVALATGAFWIIAPLLSGWLRRLAARAEVVL